MNRFKTKIEQFRQARRIHGGLVGLCVGALAVKLSRVRIPTRRLRTRVYRTIYGKKYSALDEDELEKPIWAYPSFNALFTRGMRPERRPIPEAGDHFLSPCDGRIQDVGTALDGKIMTVKGVEYTLRELLAGTDAAPFHGGQFAIIFLSPTDCHRIFSPQDAVIEEVAHVPGYRLLVHPPYQTKAYPVFALNERVILRLRTPLGACILVLVAGWGVGNITLPVDPGFRPRPRQRTRTLYDPPRQVRRGEWIATFELGSTAILVTEPNGPWTTLVQREEKVPYGQAVFARRTEDGGM
jgi:phosphatidylserine decarboxylase